MSRWSCALSVRAASIGLLLALGSCSTSPADRGVLQDLKPNQDLVPPAPNEKAMDTILFKNGEVLKGDLKSVRHFKIEFDSDKFDVISKDWKDVAELRSSRHNTIVLEKSFESVSGTVLIKDGTIVVGTEGGPRRFLRSDLYSLVPGDEGLEYWSGKLSAGLTAQTGNSDQVNYNAKFDLQRRGPYNRITMSYLGNYGKVDGDETANNHRFNSYWRRDIDDHWFVQPIGLTLYRDKFQNIALQATPSAGVGYNVANTSTLQFMVAIGAGWRYTEYDSAVGSDDNNDSAANWIPAFAISWDITPDIDLTVNLQSLHSFEDSSDTITHLDSTLSIDLFDDFDLDITLQWDRVGDPQRDSNGELPDKSDFRYSVGVGWTF